MQLDYLPRVIPAVCFIRRDYGLDANQKCPVLTFVVADARPTDAEREVWEQVDVVLKDAKGILDELQAYKGAGVEIREVPLPSSLCPPPPPNTFSKLPALSRPSRTPTTRRSRSRPGPPWFPWWGS